MNNPLYLELNDSIELERLNSKVENLNYTDFSACIDGICQKLNHYSIEDITNLLDKNLSKFKSDKSKKISSLLALSLLSRLKGFKNVGLNYENQMFDEIYKDYYPQQYEQLLKVTDDKRLIGNIICKIDNIKNGRLKCDLNKFRFEDYEVYLEHNTFNISKIERINPEIRPLETQTGVQQSETQTRTQQSKTQTGVQQSEMQIGTQQSKTQTGTQQSEMQTGTQQSEMQTGTQQSETQQTVDINPILDQEFILKNDLYSDDQIQNLDPIIVEPFEQEREESRLGIFNFDYLKILLNCNISIKRVNSISKITDQEIAIPITKDLNFSFMTSTNFKPIKQAYVLNISNLDIPKTFTGGFLGEDKLEFVNLQEPFLDGGGIIEETLNRRSATLDFFKKIIIYLTILLITIAIISILVRTYLIKPEDEEV